VAGGQGCEKARQARGRDKRGVGPQGRRLSDHPTSRRAPARQLSDEAIELIAARLRVIAEPNRIRIFRLLNEGDATVQELTDRLMTTHQNVSKHLGVLYQAGMVAAAKMESQFATRWPENRGVAGSIQALAIW
jgi:hypothetical protein